VKTLTLKESPAVYEAAVDESLRNGEPVILERDGRPVAALVPIEEYESFRAWKARRQTGEQPSWPEDKTLEEVVADLKRRGPGIPNVREPTVSLAKLLANAPHDPDFDLNEWERAWARVEAEMEAEDAREP